MKTEKRRILTLLAVCFVFAGVFSGAENIAAAQIKNISQAKEKALKKVPDAVVTEVDSDYEKGVLTYDVELVKGNKEYTIKYRASNAQILEFGWEKMYVEPDRQNECMGKNECRQLARKEVKNGKIISCVKKMDDGVDIYKLKLKTKNKKYKLVYHARTGEMLEFEWERTAVPSKNSNKGYIGVAKAKKIALALVPGAVVVKAEFDMDDGVPVYEVELIKDNYEYDFEIHAKTGKVLKQEVDWND